MSSDLPTTSYAILGLLARGPKSGYAISTLADQSIAYFWSIPRSLVYRELVRLEQLRYIDGTEVVQSKLPDKREYRLTRSGQAALERWLNQPSYEKGRSKDGFLVKFFFGRLMTTESRWGLLHEYREQARLELEDLRAIAAKLEKMPGGEFPRLTALRGVRSAEAQLQWVEDVERLIETSPEIFESLNKTEVD